MKRTARLYQWVLAVLMLGAGIIGGIILFLANRVIVATVCYTVWPVRNGQIVKLQTILMLIVPVLLMLPEWWLLDTLRRTVGKMLPRRRRRVA